MLDKKVRKIKDARLRAICGTRVDFSGIRNATGGSLNSKAIILS